MPELKNEISSLLFSRLCDTLRLSIHYQELSSDRNNQIQHMMELWEAKNGSNATPEMFCTIIRRDSWIALAQLIERTTFVDDSYPVNPGNSNNPNNTIVEKSASSSSNPFAVKTNIETLRTFVRENSAFYIKLCIIMNDHNLWQTLLRNYGLLANTEVSKLVVSLSTEWKDRKNNPTDSIFKLLADVDLGDKKIDELIADLAKIDSPELHKMLDDWSTFRNQKQVSQIEKNNTVYSANVTLRKFLIDNGISTIDDVDDHLNKLSSKDIKATKPEHLKVLEYSDFRTAGFAVTEARLIVKAVQDAKF